MSSMLQIAQFSLGPQESQDVGWYFYPDTPIIGRARPLLYSLDKAAPSHPPVEATPRFPPPVSPRAVVPTGTPKPDDPPSAAGVEIITDQFRIRADSSSNSSIGWAHFWRVTNTANYPVPCVFEIFYGF